MTNSPVYNKVGTPKFMILVSSFLLNVSHNYSILCLVFYGFSAFHPLLPAFPGPSVLLNVLVSLAATLWWMALREWALTGRDSAWVHHDYPHPIHAHTYTTDELGCSTLILCCHLHHTSLKQVTSVNWLVNDEKSLWKFNNIAFTLHLTYKTCHTHRKPHGILRFKRFVLTPSPTGRWMPVAPHSLWFWHNSSPTDHGALKGFILGVGWKFHHREALQILS